MDLIIGETLCELPIASSKLTDSERARLRRLFTIEEISGRIFVKRRSPLVSGRLSVEGVTIIARPDNDASLALPMFLYACEHWESIADATSIPTEILSASDHDSVEVLVAALLVKSIEKALQRFPMRIYRRFVNERLALAGRPLWSRTFSRPLSFKVPCEIYELATDTLMQRLLLCGAASALTLLQKTSLSDRSRKVVTVLAGLAETHTPMRRDFRVARRSLNSLTEHYRLPLMLTEALIFGTSCIDPFSYGEFQLPELIFDLAILFERVVYRFLKKVVPNYGVEVRYQNKDSLSLRYRSGRTYMSTRPDIGLFRGDRCVAVIDCKYKPRYLTGSLVSSGDIYQVLFYGEAAYGWTNQRNGQRPLLAIAVPTSIGPVLDKSKREIVANYGLTRQELLVVPINVAELLRSAENNAEAKYLAAEADLHQLFEAM